MPANLENSAVATELEKVSFHSNPKEGQCQRMFKLLHNFTHFTWEQYNAQNPSSKAQQYLNWEIPHVQTGYKKGRETIEQIANIHWITGKAREFQKNIFFIDYMKVFDCMDHNKL